MAVYVVFGFLLFSVASYSISSEHSSHWTIKAPRRLSNAFQDLSPPPHTCVEVGGFKRPLEAMSQEFKLTASTLYRLTDQNLAKILQAAKEEQSRRVVMDIANLDEATIIKCGEGAKRAALVAAAGNHSIIFVGPVGAGKTMLRALSHHLGNDETYEGYWCKCGNKNDPVRVCNCKIADIERVIKKMPPTDMYCDVLRVPAKMWDQHGGTTLEEMQERLKKLKRYDSMRMDSVTSTYLNTMMAEQGLTPRQRNTIEKVARTVANVNDHEFIRLTDVTEASIYLPPAL